MEFWEIYDQYYAKVRRFILTLVRDDWVADDLIQETFLRILQNIENLKDPPNCLPGYFGSPTIFVKTTSASGKYREEKKNGSGKKRLEDSIKEALIQKELEQREMGECVQNQIDLLPEPYGRSWFFSTSWNAAIKRLPIFLG